MAGTLNKVMIIGLLGQDPELRYSSGGIPMCNLNVATDESYMDRDGNKVDKTEWHRVSVFNKQAENCCKFLRKGSMVYVEGSLQTRKWQDQQGQDRYSTDIKARTVQFLDRKGQGDGDGFSRPAGQSARKAPSPQDEDLGPAFPSEAGMPPATDEVPF